MVRERPLFSGDWADCSQQRGPGIQSVLALVLTLSSLFLGLQAWWILTPAAGLLNGPRVVEIPTHRGVRDVALLLDEAGVIQSPFGFILLTVAKGSVRN